MRRLPFDGGRAWLSFPRSDAEPRAPDFLILDSRNRGFLLSAGDITTAEAEELLQPGLFEQTKSMQERSRKIRNKGTALEQFCGTDGHSSIPRFLILPGVSQPVAGSLAKHLEIGSGIVVSADPESLAELLEEHAGSPLEIDTAHALQAAFNLETRIPRSFVPRIRTRVTYSETVIDPRETAYLLDFNQEAWVKADLLPSNEAMQAITGTATRLVTGVAGSGKSLALLYRARLQRCGLAISGAPSHRTLFVTHNKPLIGDLTWRYSKLAATLSDSDRPPDTIDFLHFFRWCGTLHFEARLTLISHQDRRSRIALLAEEAFPDTQLSSAFFVDEIGYIADQIDDSEAAYLKADRAGRGIAMDRAQRLKMHGLYQRYRGTLAANLETDWPFIVRMLWEKIRAKQIQLPRYDTIYVDEAQFFAPVWFALLAACLTPGTGEFVVAADPTQGFLKRRLSWRSVGLNVVGRATRLKKSYRNTPAIQAFARHFYNSRIEPADHLAEETILPDKAEQTPMESLRDTPRLVKHRAMQDAMRWSANEIAAGLRSGLPAGSVLVMIEDRADLDALLAMLKEILGANRVSVLSHQAPVEGTVAVTTLNSATGIERPVVFLLGIDALFETEGDPRLDYHQRAELIRDHTRKIYMALTRAGEKLLISYRNDRTRSLLEGSTLLEGESTLNTVPR